MNGYLELWVRKNDVEGLSEQYFGEAVRVKIELEEVKNAFLPQLIADAREYYEFVTHEDLKFHRQSKAGLLTYDQVIHYLILGSLDEARRDMNNKKYKSKQKIQKKTHLKLVK
ncbi:hypothetical protein [Zooshikella harenae]|uniref:Uncharacterized protein n=1 Tax=Zooshikella harenae TaxID=2827238 RepID=A0ABS5ZI91_9GAMM|nr:hypothetical protein [Zooshikella harenae]MBU2713699.1 hypothetical protein [Zooshikella harenae]